MSSLKLCLTLCSYSINVISGETFLKGCSIILYFSASAHTVLWTLNTLYYLLSNSVSPGFGLSLLGLCDFVFPL